jgi:hypothetical protein
MRREQRWIGHRPIDAATHGQPSSWLTPGVADLLHKAAVRACGFGGRMLDLVLRALACRDKAAWEFMAWYAGREHAARCDTEEGGCPSGNGSGEHSDGIPLSTAQRIAAELPLLLRRIMDDPVGVLEDVERGVDRR